MPINAIWFIPFLLCCFAAVIIASVPSGPKCPVCERNFTREIQFTHLAKTTSKVSKVKCVACFVCKKYFDITINGIKTTNLDDLKETE